VNQPLRRLAAVLFAGFALLILAFLLWGFFG